MIERIRITLWDILTFFLTGLLVACVALAFWLAESGIRFKVVLEHAVSLPATILLFAAPLVFTPVGLLVEPFSNYFDKWIVDRTIGKLLPRSDRHASEEKVLEDEIKNNYLGTIGPKLISPFFMCKDYVEAKSLSPTFMVFLARYGFYRNCTLITLASSAYAATIADTWLCRLAIAATALFVACIFKWRANDFYSYQAPTVYRAFLVDKVKWTRDAP